MKLKVYDKEGVELREEDCSLLDKKEPSSGALYYTITAYLSNQRQGTACTKGRGEVRGGGRKPWRQKGTGRARVGSIRSPIWRGGGIVFGPKPRNYYITLPKKVKKRALFSVLYKKVKENKVILVEEEFADFPKIKTKDMIKYLSKFNIKPKERSLISLHSFSPNFILSGRNIPGIKFRPPENISAYDLIFAENLVFTLPAWNKLLERIG